MMKRAPAAGLVAAELPDGDRPALVRPPPLPDHKPPEYAGHGSVASQLRRAWHVAERWRAKAHELAARVAELEEENERLRKEGGKP